MGSHLIGVIDGVVDGVDVLSLRYVGRLSTLDESDGDNNNGIDDGLIKADDRPGPKRTAHKNIFHLIDLYGKLLKVIKYN